jgi:hypothetical protein
MATHTIEITAMSFPANTPVEKGDTVVWTNRMNMNHTVTADNGAFDSGVLGKDKSFSHVFDTVGAVAYHCKIHPNMTGTVAVTEKNTQKIPYTPAIGLRFWFEFDEATQGDDNFGNLIAQAGGFGSQNVYRTTRAQGNYPAAFVQQFQARRADWVKIAALQTDMIGNLLGNDFADIQAAFEDFAQGKLFDAQRPPGNQIHMMDGQIGTQMIGYHRWHASMRVIQLLGIGDAVWWENLNKVLGLAWAIQSFAKPKQQNTANPALANSDLDALRSAWLALTPDRRDRQYDLTPGPVGFHPSPKQPAA